VLESPTLATPLVVGVYGGWGTGKTSVMRTLEAELKSPDRVMLWFDAWVYARQEEALWRALLLRVIEALRAKLDSLPEFSSIESGRAAANAELDEARTSLYRSMTLKERGGLKVNWWGAVPLAADVALSAVTAGLNAQVAKALSGDEKTTGITSALIKWFKGSDTKEAMKLIEREASERYVEQLVSLEQFHNTFEGLLKRFRIGGERKLLIFIDDLDRCLPEDAVAALEAIKLFLNLDGCVFVLGMDWLVVEQGIKVRYKDLGPAAAFDPRQYLDKIIQVPFTLPPLGRDQINHYLKMLATLPGHHPALLCEDLIVAAAPANPRALKRILNILQLTLFIDEIEENEITNGEQRDRRKVERIRYIAKIVLLQTVYDAAYHALVQDPVIFKEVENFTDRRQTKLPDELKPLFDLPGIQALLKLPPTFNSLPDEEVLQLFTLSRVTAGG